MILFPDDQPGDPLGWAGNQAGHAMIGFGLSLVVGPIVAVLAYFIAWEVLYQIRELDGGWKDSIADTAHVAAGAVLAAFPEFAVHIYGGWMVMVALGVGARR